MLAAGAHAGRFVLSFLAPLVVLIVNTDKSPFVRRHAIESLGFELLLYLLFLVAGVLTFVTCGIGIVLFVPLLIVWVLFPVIGTIRAVDGKYYSYPMTGMMWGPTPRDPAPSRPS